MDRFLVQGGESWGFMLLGFSVAVFLAVGVFGVWKCWLIKKAGPGPPKVIASRDGNDARLPTTATGSMSVGDAFSEVTTPNIIKSGNVHDRNDDLGDEEEQKEEEQTPAELSTSFGDMEFQSDDEVDTRSLWDYSVRSFAEATVGGASTSSHPHPHHHTNNRHNDNTPATDDSVVGSPASSSQRCTGTASKVYHHHGRVLFDM